MKRTWSYFYIVMYQQRGKLRSYSTSNIHISTHICTHRKLRLIFVTFVDVGTATQVPPTTHPPTHTAQSELPPVGPVQAEMRPWVRAESGQAGGQDRGKKEVRGNWDIMRWPEGAAERGGPCNGHLFGASHVHHLICLPPWAHNLTPSLTCHVLTGDYKKPFVRSENNIVPKAPR